MKKFVIALLAAVALALPTVASEDQATYIDDLALAVIEGDPDAAAELYAISTDETVQPACQRYADVTLMGFGLIDYVREYPGSWSAQVLFDYVIDALPTFRFDCEQAI